MRLLILNVLAGIPGQLDRSTLGHPGKFTFCVAEDEDDSPWTPLAQERGVPAGASAVTVFAVESPHQIMNEWTHDPRELIDTYAAAIRGNMLTYSIWEGNYAIVVPKQHRQILAAAGWAKSSVWATSRPLSVRRTQSGCSLSRRLFGPMHSGSIHRPKSMPRLWQRSRQPASPPGIQTTRWVTCSVVARVLSVSERSVRRYCVDGLIPPVHVRRTPGGHFRIDLEGVRSLRDYFGKSDKSEIPRP